MQDATLSITVQSAVASQALRVIHLFNVVTLNQNQYQNHKIRQLTHVIHPHVVSMRDAIMWMERQYVLVYLISLANLPTADQNVAVTPSVIHLLLASI